ncbi:uncharacterized protein LOC120268260 [Dioscorea cayenensis subsp. rotundata]|uniref:Uncharacterized protein LOC120268260 n=1 Tax=Dioscorea cayennensis subsp. rotundata TaxID=55577 RepID=A0AB40BW07_DIOCR|nr:uncharacterized protein LOC120268260 [Dioscorea cayenensis subsp. rotundata]
MSAIVLGKRSNSIFEELHHHSPSQSPFDTPVSKRIRCSSSPTHIRFSPPRPSSQSPRGLNGGGVVVDSAYSAHLDHLRSLFPDMDQKFLERALEASNNDLDSAIKSLHDLCLESAELNLASALSKSVNESELNIQSSGVGVLDESSRDEDPVHPSPAVTLPRDGSEWVDLFVMEMMNASNVDDARARASRALEVLEKSIMSRVDAEAMQNFQKENMLLKEQVETLLRENNVLKRAIAIQHERQKESDEQNQEVQHLKQLVSQYQEQLRTLEVNNYALAMHLKQAQQSNSMPGRFHPDIF